MDVESVESCSRLVKRSHKPSREPLVLFLSASSSSGTERFKSTTTRFCVLYSSSGTSSPSPTVNANHLRNRTLAGSTKEIPQPQIPPRPHDPHQAARNDPPSSARQKNRPTPVSLPPSVSASSARTTKSPWCSCRVGISACASAARTSSATTTSTVRCAGC